MNPPAAALPALPALQDALARWPLAVWLRSDPYAYPTLEILHLLGIGLVFGTLWVVDLAIFGRLAGADPNPLARRVLPWTVAGFALAAASGSVMFLANVGDLIANPAIVAKMALLAAAGTNAAILHARGTIDPASAATRWQAVVSLLLWCAVIASGRLIAYV